MKRSRRVFLTMMGATAVTAALPAIALAAPCPLDPRLLNNTIGAQFKIVPGYPGNNDISIALRSSDQLRVRNALTEASDLAETTLRGVRDLSQLLHPSALDDFGLPTTLTTYLRNFSQRTGIQAHLVETVEERLAPEMEVGIYRIVQEALHNVARHSEATSCTVSLNAGDNMLHLIVEDNGRGLRTSEPHRVRRGLGLIGMRERVQALGGTFRIGGRPGGGTQISAALPLRRAPHQSVDEPMPRAI